MRMKYRYFGLILFIVFIFSCTSIDSKKTESSADFSGVFETNWGFLKLKQMGNLFLVLMTVNFREFYPVKFVKIDLIINGGGKMVKLEKGISFYHQMEIQLLVNGDKIIMTRQVETG